MAMANMQKLVFLVAISMLFFGLLISSADAAVFDKSYNPDDRDKDGIPNNSDPNPDKANIFDFVGLLGDWLSQSMIAGIVMFLVLFGVFTILGMRIFSMINQGTDDTTKNAVYIIAIGLSFAGVYFAYGSWVWNWYLGLFTAGPFVLFVVLVLAGLFVVVSWLFSTFGTAREAWRGIPGESLTEIKDGMAEAIRARKAATKAKKAERAERKELQELGEIEQDLGRESIIDRQMLDRLIYLKSVFERLLSLKTQAAKEYIQNNLLPQIKAILELIKYEEVLENRVKSLTDDIGKLVKAKEYLDQSLKIDEDQIRQLVRKDYALNKNLTFKKKRQIRSDNTKIQMLNKYLEGDALLTKKYENEAINLVNKELIQIREIKILEKEVDALKPKYNGLIQQLLNNITKGDIYHANIDVMTLIGLVEQVANIHSRLNKIAKSIEAFDKLELTKNMQVEKATIEETKNGKIIYATTP